MRKLINIFKKLKDMLRRRGNTVGQSDAVSDDGLGMTYVHDHFMCEVELNGKHHMIQIDNPDHKHHGVSEVMLDGIMYLVEWDTD